MGVELCLSYLREGHTFVMFENRVLKRTFRPKRENRMGRDYLEELGVDVKIIWKCIFRNWT
jgi:hypothetical protein